MSWAEIRERYADLVAARDSGGGYDKAWSAFARVVEATRQAPPYHLQSILNTVERARAKIDQGDLVILDHGCGSGLTLLYLLARGYRGIYGVDVGKNSLAWNRLLQEVHGIAEERFRTYDGRDLPLPDRSVDVIFSQQVLEHVRSEYIESYYAEEGRVLKPGGMVLHQVPHRLVPYDSHTRTWFIHYLPWSLRRRLYRLLGRDVERIESRIHLRWPSYHRRQVEKHIGGYEDITLDRLVELEVGDYYDGPLAVRRTITAIVSAPVVGRLAGAILRHFVMLETLAVRSSPED
ncbi:MAG: class I SAM-dependent methyltransferase [Planctomycetes bacterium]|nr:class I SAM-dependent methyltransferase [Planctomycetota bacterium]